MEFWQLLIREHEPLRRAVGVLIGMAAEAENGVTVDKHDVNALLIFLHYFGDACHQGKEEGILFPLLRQSPATIRMEESARSQLEDLLREHTEERSLIDKTQLALFSEKPFEFIAYARKLAERLTQHTLREEQVLFPMAEKLLKPEVAQSVLMRIEEADAEFGCSQRTLLIELLQQLEQKYVRKVA